MKKKKKYVYSSEKSIMNRLSRAIGHLESVRKMVEDGRDCSEVLTQLSAVESAVKNTSKLILKDHIKQSVQLASEKEDDTILAELDTVVNRFLK